MRCSALQCSAVVQGHARGSLIVSPSLSTSHHFQAKYSYKLQDLAFNHAFAPCVFARHWDGGCVFDGSRFHNTVPLTAPSRRGVRI